MIGLLLLSGCGTDAAPTSGGTSGTSRASDSPTPTEQPSLVIDDVEEVRDHGPGRLRPGDQLLRNDRGYEVYTALWTKPHYGPGSSTYPRAVSLHMTIRNGGPAFPIEAHFVSEAGRMGPLTRAPFCRSTGLIPLTIGHGAEATGCLSYYIPDDAGRLVLKGSADFGYYVAIPATAE